jgi:Transcription factor WhiB
LPTDGLLFAAAPRFEHAACQAPGVDPAIFFPEQGAPVWPAKAICRQCSHTVECLALGMREHFGIWGGTTELERRTLRRRRRTTVMDEQTTEVTTNGNASGHTVTLDPAVRVCPECSGPVPEGRKVTCSSVCAQKRDRRKGRTTPKASSPAVEIRGTGLGALAAALLSLDQLAEIESVTIETRDQVLTISSRAFSVPELFGRP